MVHNSWTQEYECADAFFALVDEGFGEGTLERVTADEVGPELAPTLEHWRQSRRPNGVGGDEHELPREVRHG